ncbi:phosphatase PAP2 family protein [Calditrichota bacterium LG25]
MVDLLNALNQLDTALFIFFNVHLANPVFDVIMPFVTDKHTWYPVWLAIIVLLSWKGGSKGRWVVIIAIVAVGTADLGVNRILKPFFQRVRPCNVVENAHLLLGKKSSFSMPSSHAANFFTLAMVFSYFYRKYQLIFWFLAALVAYSRIAVGVHYPFDVLLGALVGVAIAWSWIELFKRLLASKKYPWLK